MKITHIAEPIDDEKEILEKARQIIMHMKLEMNKQLSNDDYNSLIIAENVLCNLKNGLGTTKTIEGYTK